MWLVEQENLMGDELETVTDEEREAVLSELYDELMDDALIEVAYRAALAAQPAPVPADDEIPW
jgi:hypothetical protein